MAEEEKDYEIEQEPDTEVDVPEQENQVEASDNTDDSDDQFKKAESATQKRIDRLTKKMREAERREQEAINYARQVQTESQQLKQRMDNLDTSYVSEFSTRVTAQMEQAENELERNKLVLNKKLMLNRLRNRLSINNKLHNNRELRLNDLILKRSNGPLKTSGLVRIKP